jgi:putative membrane protein (TIGR04086 family)
MYILKTSAYDGIRESSRGVFMELKDKIISLLKALMISYIVTGIMLMAVAFAMYKMGINENAVNISIIVIYVVASFIGGFISGKMIKEQKYLWGIILGVTYMVIIGLVSFVVNGTIELSAGSTLTAFILCVAGGMLGGMTG